MYVDDTTEGHVRAILIFTDVDECNSTSGEQKCAHVCVNTEGSFACACRTGYKLENDGLAFKKGNMQEYDDRCLLFVKENQSSYNDDKRRR